MKIDPAYVPAEIERKQVFGVTFEQGRNNYKIDRSTLDHIVTKNKDLPADKAIDLIIALITLKYTQSNSVCFATDGQAIGVGAGQQSRIHCTRLAGQKADLWHLRQSEKVLSLQFAEGVGRPEKNNIIDLYLSDEADEVLADGRLAEELRRASRALHPRGEGGIPRLRQGRLARERRVLPVLGQHRARL